MDDQEQDGVCGNCRNHGMAALKFHYSCDVGSATGCLADFFGGKGDGWCQSSEVFAVEVAVGAGVYQESITSQNHYGLDTFALREGPDEVVYGGQ
jgi:hypothetical protein